MLCWRSIPVILSMLGPTTCICAHRMFPLLCLDGDLLEVNRMQLHFYNPTYLEGLDRNRLVLACLLVTHSRKKLSTCTAYRGGQNTASFVRRCRFSAIKT
uniref:Secreted protein n=1 Tax=Rhipicephalus appendiculatus TaxID=34631 RepID=A0A131YD11_RHIAP